MKRITGIFDLVARLVLTLISVALLAVTVANVTGTETPKAFNIAMQAYTAFVVTVLAICAAVPAARKYFTQPRSGLAYTTYVVDLFIKRLIETLWPDDSFLLKSVDHTSEVKGGSVVHIPKFTASPTSIKNPSVYPLAVVHRGATDLSYTLDYLATAPEAITVKDFNELNYDHLDAVLKNHQGAQGKGSAEVILNTWFAGAYGEAVRTSGASRAASAPSATGNRKKLTLADLQDAQAIMDNNDIPVEGRYALLTPTMIKDLQQDTNVNKYDYDALANIAKGNVPMLAGFMIIKRSKVGIFDNTAEPVLKDYTDASYVGATSDNAAGICWQQDQVARALGEVKVFAEKDSPTYQADICSTSVRCGGVVLRAEGVIKLVEAAA